MIEGIQSPKQNLNLGNYQPLLLSISDALLIQINRYDALQGDSFSPYLYEDVAACLRKCDQK